MAITTNTLIKSDWLNIDSSDTSKDTLLTTLISYASAHLRNYCNQPIEQESVDKIFAGDGTTWHDFYYTVPITISSLSYRDTPLDSWTTISNSPTVYSLQDSVLYYDDAYSEAWYKAALSVGYASNAIPNAIKEVCSEMVVELYKATAHGEDSTGVSQTSISQGGVTTTKVFNDVLKRNELKLQRYVMTWL